MQVVLVMFRSDGERRSFSVVRNLTVIGRREDCDLRIPVGDVSRKHCRILTSDDGVLIEDLGSSNGTYVNQIRVQRSELNPGDTVSVGPVQFVVQINGEPDDDDLTAPIAAAMSNPADSEVEDHSPAAGSASRDHQDDEEEMMIEEPAEEEVAQAQPIDKLPGDKLSADDSGLDEMTIDEEPELLEEQLDEVEEAPKAVEEELEPLEELDETLVPQDDELEESLLMADSAEVDNLEDLELDELPTNPEVVVEEELEELPLPPPVHKKEAIEELSLDEAEPAAPHANGNGATAEGSAWDFVIEETETEHRPRELHIDLDAPHPPRS